MKNKILVAGILLSAFVFISSVFAANQVPAPAVRPERIQAKPAVDTMTEQRPKLRFKPPIREKIARFSHRPVRKLKSVRPTKPGRARKENKPKLPIRGQRAKFKRKATNNHKRKRNANPAEKYEMAANRETKRKIRTKLKIKARNTKFKQ